MIEKKDQFSSEQETINFSVDAGIINRLGKELVGRAETAVSELVKNSYDADATIVDLKFINSNSIGGELLIIDDGHGMNKQQLINGFMRLSSSDKLHNPASPKYKRIRAGKKGIGRFAAQRLGNKLTILTKVEGDTRGLKLEVDWNRYKIDEDLSSIRNPISEVELDFEYGTKLIISDLREVWGDSQMKRVYRYVSDLLQPSFLSDRSSQINIASRISEDTFNTRFYKIIDNEVSVVADVDSMVFDQALGVIEGRVINGRATCNAVSRRFNIDDEIDIAGDFSLLNEVHFKSYYFIYNFNWYEGFIPKMEYNTIKELGAENGGIKLYRNGFRVLPYGEIGNDWVNIDKTSVKTQDNAYVPFNNPNFFGFVEVIDQEGRVFEETSSREGLIENDAFWQLTDFLNKSLRQATQRINSARIKEKNLNKNNQPNANTTSADNKTTKEKLEGLKSENVDTNAIIEEVIQKLEEVEMLRVLAGIGLNISEFTHEIRQFIPSFNGSINYLLSQELPQESNESLVNLKENFNRFKSYTNYIDHTITQYANREKGPVDLRKAIRSFHRIVINDLNSENILLEEDYYGYDLYTFPMHPAEWTSILYNLYTNAKKAIKRAKPSQGKIKLISGRDKTKVYLEFMDNGDGIPDNNKDRVFDAFFTTSTPEHLNSSANESVTGTGLGLKIIKDIISAYHGLIFITSPEEGYVTNFRIEIPEATSIQLEKYGY
jgi:signal transduction histidine kinase